MKPSRLNLVRLQFGIKRLIDLEIPVANQRDNRPHFLRAPHLNVECFSDLETPQGR
jgi:hypothetical protein